MCIYREKNFEGLYLRLDLDVDLDVDLVGKVKGIVTHLKGVQQSKSI